MNNEIYEILETQIAVPRKPFSESQLHILKQVIQRKHISKQFFDDLLYYAFGCKSYLQLDYEKMYRLIYVLNRITLERK